MACENFREDTKTSGSETVCTYKLKQHKPWFDEEFLGFLDKRKQAKIQWLRDPSQINVDNLNNIRCEASRLIRNKQ
jgi:hypothetical protein